MPILLFCAFLSFEIKAQNVYTCINPKKKTKTAVLKDSADNTILSYTKKRISFQNNVYKISRSGFRIILNDSLKNTKLGFIKQFWTVRFTHKGHTYRVTRINKKGYNFTLKSENNDEVCKVKFSETLLENNFEIHNLTNPELLPYVFMVSLVEIENSLVRKKLPQTYFLVAMSLLVSML